MIEISEKKGFDLKAIKLLLPKQLYQYQIDILVALILAIGIAISSYLGSQTIPDSLFTDLYAQDTWFGADLPTVFGNITSLQSDYGRNNKHPLFPLLIFPPIFILGKLLHLDSVTAVRIIVSLTAALWIGLLFTLFRLMGCRRLDSALFSLVGGVSAAAVFWFSVPESFPFGSVTILSALVLVALAQYRKLSPAWYVAVSALTVSITITNWMVGLLATIVNHRWKKALQITTITFFIVNALWIVQRSIFRNAGYPFSLKTLVGEKKFMSAPEANSTLSAVSSFFYQTIVTPAIQLTNSMIRPGWPKPNVDTLVPGSGGFWGTVAAVSWTGLFILGLWGFCSTKRHLRLRIVLGLTFLGQLLIHSVYGSQETFIYSLHFAPLLLTVAAFSSLTRLRLLGLALAVVLIVSAGINNRTQFNQFTAALIDYGTPGQQVQAHMRVRSSDPWPRGVGHIVLAVPGSREENKAYHEPGGSFSPTAGSFGVSIWMLDQQGKLKITGDDIPRNQIQQQFIGSPEKNPPGILTKTNYYQASWSRTKSGNWQLNLKLPANSNAKPVVVIRSVGPAGGPIHSLDYTDHQLQINNRWSVKNVPNLAKVYLGSENSPGWISQKLPDTHWQDEKGWGYARLELAEGNTWDLEFENSIPAPKPELTSAEVPSNLALELPDSQFVNSFNAQISHLMMGLVGNRTRPGDPLSAPLSDFREGAYQMVALARVGHLEVAKQLSSYFAETDFSNGFAPEADIPALGIWALEAVATQVNQSDYDRWLWPHIQRKAELIVDMLSSNKPGYPVATKSELPFSEYPDFLKLDLTAGIMEASSNLISIDPTANLMSYRALLDAAALADRLNLSTQSVRWRSHAQQLKSAWEKAFDPQFKELNATYANGLWPSWIAGSVQTAFAQALQTRWNNSHNPDGSLRQIPPNPSLNLAESHQWLFLGKLDPLWASLQWFWKNQASPGLFSWGEIPNTPTTSLLPKSFSHWNRLRGWVNAPTVTPHYGAAAQMLLLQLDMLAFVNQSASQPTLVIGAGIPPSWLSHPMKIKNIPLENSSVDWSWDGKQMNVLIRKGNFKVLLGPAFPPNTPLKVEALPLSTNLPSQTLTKNSISDSPDSSQR
ncbi:MAG: hypothetical protein WCA35_07320 [Kovacikia sp.]